MFDPSSTSDDDSKQASVFLLPVTISRTRTPKLYTSSLTERCPMTAYSGAMYPLQDKTILLGRMVDVGSSCMFVMMEFY